MAKISPEPTVATPKAPVKYTCGLVMPISAIDGCSSEHWAEVKAIVAEAIEGIADSHYAVRLVSDADDVGVIQKRIVQNVYSSDIVVCDVSGKNPNVMFELGLRLAFDKPTIIVKDDKTDYSFDTGVIEHIAYPRDLRFSRIVEFKKVLAAKVVSTHQAALADPNQSTFLKNFGKFQVATLSSTEVSADRVMLEMLTDIQTELAVLRRRTPEPTVRNVTRRVSRSDTYEKLAAAIFKVVADNSLVVSDALASDNAFIGKVSVEMNASEHFDNFGDFQEACKTAVRVLLQDQPPGPTT